ncbi:hypothetical protein BSL78_16062 [Apostichopus japonicus]|uniref:Fibrinogen C-terminal domain-containing protein n=1 Tax=Stichopus japonicus TaxID=307972 RepID=A0A2G8KGH6_STIJA|nr:hypothetical protein BSL78_16062 [Apostichopus japonicus]
MTIHVKELVRIRIIVSYRIQRIQRDVFVQKNHMILGDSCIPQEQCGCYVQGDGVVLTESETYINSDCSLRITCNSNVLTSERYSCSADATCEKRKNIHRCYCNEWFEGNGVTCTRSGPRDCSDLFAADRRNNGKYTIYPAGSSGFEVYCEMSNGGWTVTMLWGQIQGIDSVHTMKTMMDRVPSTAQKNTEVAGGIQMIVVRALPTTATHSANAKLQVDTSTLVVNVIMTVAVIIIVLLVIHISNVMIVTAVVIFFVTHIITTQKRCCANINPIYETTFHSCGNSNLNGDYSFSDNRGIFWKNLHGSDCGIKTTTMEIQPSQ